MSEEVPKLVLAANDCMMHRAVGSVLEQELESDLWVQSMQVPGVQIINIWQVYKSIWLILTKTEGGHFQILRSDLVQHSLVHDHSTEIFNLFWVDDGIMLFCATDGWWHTADTGLTWSQLPSGVINPVTASASIIPLRAGAWALIAYDPSHKIFIREYIPSSPGSVWTETCDVSSILVAKKWYPAVAGGPVGILAGAGTYLLRATMVEFPFDWHIIAEAPGTIKSIAISDQSAVPKYLIVVESVDQDQLDKIYLTDDLGDTLYEVRNRVGILAAVQSVIPTGLNEAETLFAMLGSRAAGGPVQYSLQSVLQFGRIDLSIGWDFEVTDADQEFVDLQIGAGFQYYALEHGYGWNSGYWVMHW